MEGCGARVCAKGNALYALYQWRLPVELVTLSGCATGRNVVVGGNELLGLVRVLRYAGIQSVMVSLWHVQDKSTAELMTSFYARLGDGRDKAKALCKRLWSSSASAILTHVAGSIVLRENRCLLTRESKVFLQIL